MITLFCALAGQVHCSYQEYDVPGAHRVAETVGGEQLGGRLRPAEEEDST